MGTLVLAGSGVLVRADETFLCEDGSSITIDSTNRTVMQDHPCVRAWFVNDLARRQARQGANGTDARDGAQGGAIVHRYTVRRAMALRDLQQRPAYVAWLRARAREPQPAARWNGSRRAHVPTLLDRPAVQAPTRSAMRFRFRRR
jgi:hypothetical protein